MRKTFKVFLLLLLALIGFQSCEDMDDTIAVSNGLEVENFIWKGLNLYYLWKADVPDLADDRFANQKELDSYLSTYNDPFVLFDSLRVQESTDRFSILVDDYTVLENLFQGITKNNGVDFGLRYKQGSTTEIFGWVRYIIPNSDASNKPIQRGSIFYAVNGTALTTSNYQSLLSTDDYTVNLANYDNGAITPNGQSVALTKTELTENPIFQKQVITAGTHKIAYLVYNGFTANFDGQLNSAFGEFTAAGATDLVLDLRYNSGGSVQTAARLASMITGQFNGQLFAKQQWNAAIQSYFEANNPGQLVNNFSNSIGSSTINSLNLSKVYILTTKSTASASELVINGLKPYIDVVQIGDVTTGKNVGSITLYDSPTFGRENRSSKHKYAMQPIVIKTINKDGFGDYQAGLQPTIPLIENLNDLSQLGNQQELLLSAAIQSITTGGRRIDQSASEQSRDFKDSKSLRRFGTDMYIENK
jgi:carboxyl-terminal processing protease